MEENGKKALSERAEQERLDLMRRMCQRPQATDVLGSYTGTPADGGKPVQDADDL